MPPGKAGQVTLELKTDGDAGQKIKKSATVFTNDPENSKLRLTIEGEIVSAAKIMPKAARLMGHAGEKIAADITITPIEANPFDIVNALADKGKNYTYSLEKKPGAPGDKAAYILHVSNKINHPGRYFDKIALHTTSKISPVIIIRVFGIIR
ncbi:MAG: DUF1573 domain-containing protein [Deltaproteobacteria bacterium]|nr:DUF1573 domain-containing protein [Deltaproteobacteria bacterium]